MDGSYQDTQRPPGAPGGRLQAPQRGAGQPDLSAPSWTYGRQPFGLRGDFSVPPPGFGGPPFPPPYGYDPQLPPPPFGCPPPDRFPRRSPLVQGNAPTVHGFSPQVRAGAPAHCSQARSEGGLLSGGPGGQPEEQGVLERRRDAEWLQEFLQRRGRTRAPQTPPAPVLRAPQAPQTPPAPVLRAPQAPQTPPAPVLREVLYGAVLLLSQLEKACRALQRDLDGDRVQDGDQNEVQDRDWDWVWEDRYQRALWVQRELRVQLEVLADGGGVEGLRRRGSRLRRRRTRILRTRKDLELEAKEREEIRCEKEGAIDRWRRRRVLQVEERKKDLDLKRAADAVLSEVRKKMADVMKMQDVLKALDRLRRVRQEAASRKGVSTLQQSDTAFGERLQRLRAVLSRRTELYSAEEKALMVMLEGEQEEERRREGERRARRERERQLQRRLSAHAMLFGEDQPADGVLGSFRDYYSQAEASMQFLLHIRREWDVFLVPADHPEGSCLPQSWILPEPPSDQAWASALQDPPTDL